MLSGLPEALVLRKFPGDAVCFLLKTSWAFIKAANGTLAQYAALLSNKG